MCFVTMLCNTYLINGWQSIYIASLIKRFSNWKSLNIAKIQNLKQLHAKETELKYARKASNQGVNFIQVTPKTLG